MRTYDLLIFQRDLVPGVMKPTVQALALPGDGGLGCTGIQKLAQLVLTDLLNEQASSPYVEGGTNLIGAFARGEVQSDLDVFQAFGFAAARTTQTLQGRELDTDELDERLDEIVLDRVAILPGYVQLFFHVTSLAGSSYQLQPTIQTLV